MPISKHTPGPWRANHVRGSNDPEFKFACAVWSEKGDTPICSTNFSVGKYLCPDVETRDANARVIAATPELLEACKDAAELINVCRQYFPKSAKNSDKFKLELTCATLLKAISKAEVRE